MAKQREPLTEQDEMSDMSQVQTPPHDLLARLHALEERVAELEKCAHSDHQLGKEVVDQITTAAASHAVTHMNEHLRRVIGHSGLPVRGDQE